VWGAAAMALNIVFGGDLGNLTASELLDIPDGQLKTDVRFPFSPFYALTHPNTDSVNPRATPRTRLSKLAETRMTHVYAVMLLSPLSSFVNSAC